MKTRALVGVLLICIAAYVFWQTTRRPVGNRPVGNEQSVQLPAHPYGSSVSQIFSAGSSQDGVKVNSALARQVTFSNSVATLLTSSYSWWLGDKPLPLDELGIQELAAYRGGAHETVSNIVTSDLADGINNLVRVREHELRKLAMQITVGSAMPEVISLIGRPDVVDLITVKCADDDSHIGGIQTYEVHRTNAVPGVASTNDVIAAVSYWPRAGVPFDGKNGQGYRVLYLVFDQTRILRSVFWEQPSPLIRGRITPNPRDTNYWYGKLEESPPPLGMSWR